MIYYKHYIGDYQVKTGHLTLAQDGAYRRLMDHYYSNETPLPSSKDALYRICGAMEKKEREAVDFVIASFFEERKGQLHHQRIDEEVSIAQEKIANLKANGQAGGKKSGTIRAIKNEANALPNAEANGQAKLNIVSSQYPNTSNEVLKPKARQEVALPDWLPALDWNRFVEYRKKASGKKFTSEAETLNLSRMKKLFDSGNSPAEVIDQTIANGWSGLFEIKQQRGIASNSKHVGFENINYQEGVRHDGSF
jgi:uncharacterized protein YdaU (DUF1376 family)